MNWIGFANPWMLTALAAVGLPVLIHYLTRARPRRIVFPPFRFLQEACAGQQALHRLRTFLLLALRTLAVLALVLLFARPFLKPTGAAATNQSTRRVAVVIDASLSMRAVQRGVSLFARAQTEAAEVLRALESGSEATVILAGTTPHPLLPALSPNLALLHEELVRAAPSHEFGDPAAALALAQKLLGPTGTIYVFSDFQLSNWRAVRELPGGIVTRLRSVAPDPIDNVALTAARLAPAEPVVGEPAEILCSVYNSSARPRQETVRLELGDFTQESRVSVPPFGTADAVFNLTFAQTGPVAGRAMLAPDDLSEDNVRYLALTVQKALQILLISDAEATDRGSAAWFIGRALAPSAAAAPGFSLARRHSQNADRGVLETSDVYILAAPAQPPGEVLEIIQRRVQDGAHFIAFLDGPTSTQLMPPALAAPFRILRTATADPGEFLLPGQTKLFPDSDSGDFSTVRFRRHQQTQALDGRAGEFLLVYPDQSAALTLSAAGKGSVVFANLPLTADGSDLAGSPMFPAMVHEVVRLLRRTANEQAATPGNAWTIDAPTPNEGNITVTDPQGRPVVAPVVSAGRTTRLALPRAELPGVYLAKQNGATIATAAVNIDGRESDTRPLSLDSLKSGAGAIVAIVRDEEDLLMAGKNRPLWPELALVAMTALALEMLLLAFWRRSRAAPVAPENRGGRLEPDKAARAGEEPWARSTPPANAEARP